MHLIVKQQTPGFAYFDDVFFPVESCNLVRFECT